MSLGVFIVRVVFGALIAAHGSQKLFGWLGGYGIAGTGGFFESLGFRPGRMFAALAGAAEFVGGILIALGFLGPVGPALMVSVMIVAMVSVHWEHGLFASSNGIEVPLLYAATGAALAFTGAGQYSVDGSLGLAAVWTPGVNAAVLAAALIGGVVSLVLRRPAHAAVAA
jgi:putative oxidoreductase